MRGRNTPLGKQIPLCSFCPDEVLATRWRLPDNPPWGLDANYDEVEEEWAYRIWEIDGAPADAYGTCDKHLYAKRNAAGDVELSARGRFVQKQQEAATPKPTRAQVRRNYRTGLRSQVIEKLGGQCSECDETSQQLLQIRFAFQTLPDSARGKSLEEWHRQLLAQPELLQLCTLRCLAHAGSSGTDQRAAVVAAYGGACAECGVTEGLWVVPQDGTEVPRYPGGRKYGSRDKLRWLAQQGFPPGWELRCPVCAR